MNGFNNLLETQFENMKDLTSDNFMEVLREQLDKHLTINNISPEEFAKRVGVSGRTIRFIQEGRTDDVMGGNMLRIFEAVYCIVKVTCPDKK